MKPRTIILLLLLFAPNVGSAENEFKQPEFIIDEKFTIELVAAPPLVKHPMLATIDPQGRMFISESDGQNLQKAELLKQRPRFVRMLEDTDRDGIYDKSTIFADKMVMPEGALWHQGALYIISSPYLWRLEDTDGDGVADRRDKILGYMEFDGRANQHGPWLGPNGLLYFTGGIFGYDLVGTDGVHAAKGTSAGVFSCRLDGSDIRVVCHAGINPVEIAFTPRGDMLGTCAIFDSVGGRHDSLSHWVHGGQYGPKDYGSTREGSASLKRTGYRLGTVVRWGQVAPAGLLRYRGQHLGKEYRDDFFSCHFNTHAVHRSTLIPSGSTFGAGDEVFLRSPSIDFHPTDVMEDHDGSLLVIDTGGWLSWGCPTSKLAKPQLLGAIYRIRRKDGAKTSDPLGEKINWKLSSHEDLTALLADQRPRLRDRARETLVSRGKGTEPALVAFLEKSGSPEARVRAIWALSRTGGEKARSALRAALGDSDQGVRQAASRSLGELRDAAAIEALCRIVKDGARSTRRVAAEALGKIGGPNAVQAILQSMETSSDDYLDHALCYALIDIADADGTLAGLSSRSSLVRRLSLVALDRMGARLAFKQVLPLLDTEDAALKRAALEIAGRHPDWAKNIASLLDNWLKIKNPDPSYRAMLRGAIKAFITDPGVRIVVARHLEDEASPAPKLASLLEAIARSGSTGLPAEWAKGFREVLDRDNEALQGQAISTLRAVGETGFRARLLKLAAAPGLSLDLRVSALASISRDRGKLDDGSFALLLSQVSPESQPSLQLQASRALSDAALSTGQLSRLAERLPQCGPLELPLLVSAFERPGMGFYVNVDVDVKDAASGRVSGTHRGKAAAKNDPAGDQAVWNSWNPLSGARLNEVVDSRGNIVARLTVGNPTGAGLTGFARGRTNPLLVDFVFNGRTSGGGSHQEYVTGFELGGLDPAGTFDLVFYGTWEPLGEKRQGAEVRVQHSGGIGKKNIAGMATDRDVFTEGASHASFRNLRPLADGKLKVSWTAALNDRKENQGAFNGFSLASRTVGKSPAIEQLGNKLLTSLRSSKGLTALAPGRLERVLQGYPPSVRGKAASLLEKMVENDREKAQRIQSFLARKEDASIEKGRELFFGKKSACSTCHKIGERGGDIGPNLSRIGQIRTWRDLLESTIYPSSTIVNSYETYTIITRKGLPLTGIIHHETADTVTLRNARLEETTIARSSIVRMEPTPLSLMPQGLDKNIGDEDFPHIIAFLKSLR